MAQSSLRAHRIDPEIYFQQRCGRRAFSEKNASHITLGDASTSAGTAASRRLHALPGAVDATLRSSLRARLVKSTQSSSASPQRQIFVSACAGDDGGGGDAPTANARSSFPSPTWKAGPVHSGRRPRGPGTEFAAQIMANGFPAGASRRSACVDVAAERLYHYDTTALHTHKRITQMPSRVKQCDHTLQLFLRPEEEFARSSAAAAVRDERSYRGAWHWPLPPSTFECTTGISVSGDARMRGQHVDALLHCTHPSRNTLEESGTSSERLDEDDPSAASSALHPAPKQDEKPSGSVSDRWAALGGRSARGRDDLDSERRPVRGKPPPPVMQNDIASTAPLDTLPQRSASVGETSGTVPPPRCRDGRGSNDVWPSHRNSLPISSDEPLSGKERRILQPWEIDDTREWRLLAAPSPSATSPRSSPSHSTSLPSLGPCEGAEKVCGGIQEWEEGEERPHRIGEVHAHAHTDKRDGHSSRQWSPRPPQRPGDCLGPAAPSRCSEGSKATLGLETSRAFHGVASPPNPHALAWFVTGDSTTTVPCQPKRSSYSGPVVRLPIRAPTQPISASTESSTAAPQTSSTPVSGSSPLSHTSAALVSGPARTAESRQSSSRSTNTAVTLYDVLREMRACEALEASTSSKSPPSIPELPQRPSFSGRRARQQNEEPCLTLRDVCQVLNSHSHH